MKKTLKLSLIFLLMIALLFGITACGNDKKEENTKTGESSKTYKVLGELFKGDTFTFIAEGNINTDTEELQKGTITMALNGEDIYMDVKSDEERMTIIYKDKVSYLISHEEKSYIKTEGENENLTKEDALFISEEELEDIKKQEYKTGKEKVEGKEYEYEEFKDDEDITRRYYFEGDNLVYIKTIDKDEEELIKVIELSNNVDEKLFEIPAEYEEISL